MTSEIRANTIKNRVGLGTIEYSNTGPVISGVTTASNFKTGTSNLHSTGLNIFDLDVDGHTNLDNVSIAGVTTFSGNIGGTATFQDIDVDGHTNLDNVNVVGVTTTTGDVTIGSGGETTALGVRVNSAYAQIKLPDGQTGANRKGNLSFGDNDDFRIVHDGHHNYITAGAGDIYVSTSSANPVNIFNNKINVNVDLNLIDTATDSAAGPEFKLFRNSASPADADYLGQIKFAGESDAGVERNYAKITGKILDASNGTEDGILEFAHIKAGSQTITGRWRSDSLQLLNGTALTVAGSTTVTGNIIPSSDSATDIGTNSVRFANLYADTLYGDGSNLTNINSTSATGDFSIADKIIHTGDTNTAIRFPSNDQISFETGGTDRGRFDDDGNFIIGATGHGNASTYARKILISGNSNVGLTIHTNDTSGSNRKCSIFFGTGTSVADMADGMLFYDHQSKYMHLSVNGAGTGITKSSIRLSLDGTVRFDSTPTDGNSISLLIKSHKSRAENDNNGIVFRDASDHSQAAINVTKRSTVNAASELVFRTSDGGVTSTLQGVPERLRIGRTGQIGIAGANYGTARQTIVSGGASASVSWSSNPFLLDMDGLGDIDYDGVFLRYREVNVSGNGLVHLGLCKSTTNCTPGRIGVPVGFIPGVAYNSHFRVDKVGITPWPDSSGHRYEFYAIISDYVSAGKLGIFYLTNSTN